MKWTPHVIAVIGQHPRARELSLPEVEALGQVVLPALKQAVEVIRLHAQGWTAGETGEERVAIYSEVWMEAARVWRKEEE